MNTESSDQTAKMCRVGLAFTKSGQEHSLSTGIFYISRCLSTVKRSPGQMAQMNRQSVHDKSSSLLLR